MSIFVKFGKIPGRRVEEFVFDEGTTLDAAMNDDGVKEFLGDTGGFTVSLNGRTPSDGAVLENGNTVLLTTKVKGN